MKQQLIVIIIKPLTFYIEMILETIYIYIYIYICFIFIDFKNLYFYYLLYKISIKFYIFNIKIIMKFIF